MRTRRPLLGETNARTAAAMYLLDLLQYDQSNYVRAERLLRQAVEIYKKSLVEGHATYARNLNNLASVYSSQEDYAKAEPFFRRAVAITRKRLESISVIQSERQ